MKRIIPENIPDADDVAIVVVAVARVFGIDPETVVLEDSALNAPSLPRWYAYDLLCREWPGCPRSWCARAVGYREKQCGKVFTLRRATPEVTAEVRRAWEALRAGSRPSEIGTGPEELPPFLSHPRGSQEVLEASRPIKLVAVPLPPADATKARLRAFLATVVANTGGVKAS